MEISYQSIKAKIKTYYQNKSYIEEIIIDENRINQILSSLNQNNDQELITDFYMVNTDGVKVLFYDSVNKLDNKKVSHILTYKQLDKNYPVFKLDYHESISRSVDYRESTYTIYKENSHKILNRISFKTLNDYEFENTDITILEDIDNVRYNRKQYSLFIKLNQLLSIKNNNEMFISGKVGFINREMLVMKDIHDNIMKIESKIKETLGEDIKIYQIKRKK